ncbi:MAG: PspC domain-containing protein [Bifidobacteriaceae bacterium]|nr:PspC domain-containing protein [Bifidobacteriaceae bacterium]
MSAPIPSTQPPGAAFFSWIRAQGIVRSSDRWFGGVAGGIARRLGWDPILVRGLFVVTAMISGVGLGLYGVAWLVLPEESDGRIHLEDVIHARLTAGFWGGAIFAFLGLMIMPTWMWVSGPIGWIMVMGFWVAALVLMAVVANRARSQMAAQPPAQAPGPAAPPPAPAAYPPGGPAPSQFAPAAPVGEAGAALPFPQTDQEHTMTTQDDAAAPAPSATPPAGSPAPPPPGEGAPAPAPAPQDAPAEAATAPDASPGAPTQPLAAGAPPGAGPGAPYAPYRGGPRPAPAPSAGPWAPPAPRGRPPGGLATLSMLGVMLLALAGAVGIGRYAAWGWNISMAGLAFGVMAVLTGIGMVVLGALGRRFGGFLAAGLTLTVLAAPIGAIVDDYFPSSLIAYHEEGAATAYAPEYFSSYVSEGEYFQPAHPDELAMQPLSFGAGDITVDLTAPGLLTAGDLTVDISLDFGHAVIVLPRDTPVVVNARVTAGRISTYQLPDDLWTVSSADTSIGETTGRETGEEKHLYEVAGVGARATIVSSVEASDSRPTLTVNYRSTAGDLELSEQG